MYLKNIEIRGFKSFADKTELTFKRGVTAVVGPNGSGKSNISDAIRWVLGEQSVKSLRGGKMEDVIFAGTQYRKPVGLAQVSLTLDNSDEGINIDYSHITISRRLYRSGESEYFINNTQCRLKDIQELFMDTGIGKEGYSIIGQGKIDAILSGKPEERRGLFEEAAGIVKFKTRKEEAEKKLQNTDANLIRIEDILSTYEERLEPLKIENEKAKDFLDYSSKLKEKEVNIIIYLIHKNNEELKDIQYKIDELKKQSSKLFELKEKKGLELENTKKYLETIDEKNAEDKNKFYQSKSAIAALHSECKFLYKTIEDLLTNIRKNQIEISNYEEKQQGLKNESDKYIEELKNLKQSQTISEKNLKDVNSIISSRYKAITYNEDTIRKLKEDQIDIITSSTEIKNFVTNINNEIKMLNEKINDLNSSCDSYVNSISINKNTYLILENEKSNTNKQVNKMEIELKDKKSEMAKIKTKLSNNERKLREKLLLESKLEANKNMLINLDKQYEGYNKSVKLLMGDLKKGKVRGINDDCYVLGEVITVPKEYETGLEIALGASISNIITKDEEMAKKLIEHLKKANLGRATFLPLNIIRGKRIQIDERVKNIKGFIGIASDLISFDSKFKSAIDYILGKTIVAEDMDAALNIAKKVNYSNKIVTLNGEVLNPGGSLTGGSIYHKSISIIGRKREIQEISQQLKNITAEIGELNKQISLDRSNLKNIDEYCLNLMDSIHSENIEIAKINEKIMAIKLETEKLSKTLEASKEEIGLINDGLKDLDIELEEKKKLDQELENKIDINNKEIYNLEEETNKIKKLIDEHKEKLTNLKVKKAEVDQMVLAKEKELTRICNDIEENKLKLGKLENENEKYIYNKEESSFKIKKNEKNIKELEGEITKLQSIFETDDLEKLKLKEQVKHIESNLFDLNENYEEVTQKVHKLQINLAKVETEKDGLYSKLNSEFSMTYAEALQIRYDSIDVKALSSEVNVLKNRINNLGMVNVGAIEEYRELKEKYNFMNDQREDLIKAKGELETVIDEMLQNMKEVFSENFNKLRIYFNETFKELFKGGSADLIISKGDELSGNIEINVQPPGKKLQNINLMSGGEKVLSAIALLFAILRMKPTPFCILDEIEAALDDANVVRYAEFLRQFASNIQFIVITHRKGTMEASDVMYGVTMQEKGISKIISMDLGQKNVI